MNASKLAMASPSGDLSTFYEFLITCVISVSIRDVKWSVQRHVMVQRVPHVTKLLHVLEQQAKLSEFVMKTTMVFILVFVTWTQFQVSIASMPRKVSN